MPFSSGTFSLVAGNPVVTGTIISSTWANNTLNDLASGLSTCVLKDGTQTTTSIVPFALGVTLGGGNTLATYVEGGSFTPSIGGSATYTVQTGVTAKIGKIVHFVISLNINAIGTGSTTVISGLPFGGNALTIPIPCFASNSSTLASTPVSISPKVDASAGTITILSRAAASANDSANAIFGNGASINISGWYQSNN